MHEELEDDDEQEIIQGIKIIKEEEEIEDDEDEELHEALKLKNT